MTASLYAEEPNVPEISCPMVMDWLSWDGYSAMRKRIKRYGGSIIRNEYRGLECPLFVFIVAPAGGMSAGVYFQ